MHKLEQPLRYLPILTTEAGNCLTMANWQEIGIHDAAYQLSSLLLKPGIQLLQNVEALRDYTGWQGAIILDARFEKANREGLYSIRSPYDGNILKISSEELLTLMMQLQVDWILLPADFDLTLLSSLHHSTPFLISKSTRDLTAGHRFGLYRSYNGENALQDFLKTQGLTSESNLRSVKVNELVVLEGLNILLSDSPAKLAYLGQVYSHTGILNLQEIHMAHQHRAIDEECSCPTCEQGLTRAYLHHLLAQTPLLCQRFLIQHNAHYFQNYLNSCMSNKIT
ncbi:hypothetical protein [Legionella jordanis]|uniref:Queuine tRNA-ribosyltransferase n=1 Tax=Legionella jordanis TaxID=456 RepID=A0A0W0VF03_9GAMM|nr:hypothetical protein [Legionella jordanis]KTD18461.1 queuine tRNA-ribosyltransferase [Legionella jordanis]RMX05366.1 queuine tRNA-ribosyltransferase [Legionella jordanis]RMX20786.1 queuine tRNA-ribosyltransferase [Legionella jordanis]VEH13191.1 queuine tRNA-ribosyltransferase [Legionella jordanis]